MRKERDYQNSLSWNHLPLAKPENLEQQICSYMYEGLLKKYAEKYHNFCIFNANLIISAYYQKPLILIWNFMLKFN